MGSLGGSTEALWLAGGFLPLRGWLRSTSVGVDRSRVPVLEPFLAGRPLTIQVLGVTQGLPKHPSHTFHLTPAAQASHMLGLVKTQSLRRPTFGETVQDGL